MMCVDVCIFVLIHSEEKFIYVCPHMNPAVAAAQKSKNLQAASLTWKIDFAFVYHKVSIDSYRLLLRFSMFFICSCSVSAWSVLYLSLPSFSH